MSRMKPIQATPELTGEDARRAIEQVFKEPTPEAIEWNERMFKSLEKILKD